MDISTYNFNKKRNDKFVEFKANVILTSTSHIHLHNQFDEMIKTEIRKQDVMESNPFILLRYSYYTIIFYLFLSLLTCDLIETESSRAKRHIITTFYLRWIID